MKKFVYSVFIENGKLWYFIAEEEAEDENMKLFPKADIVDRRLMLSIYSEAAKFSTRVLNMLKKNVLYGTKAIYGQLDEEEEVKTFFDLFKNEAVPD
jgi:hypothetical protein